MFEFWPKLTLLEKVKYVSSRLGLVLLVLFCVFNWQEQIVDMIFFKMKIPLTLLIIISFILGILISFYNNYKLNSTKEEQAKIIHQKNQEILALKAELETKREDPAN